MMNLYESIRFIYPNIQDNEFILKNDGDGPYIADWNYSEPQPTQEELVEANAQLKPPVIPLSQSEQNEKDIAGLTFTLMMNGVI